MSEMIERVARAICETTSGTGDDHQWEMFVDEARAAIEAMREPTPQMVDSGMACEAGTFEEDIQRIFKTMIDTALSEQPV